MKRYVKAVGKEWKLEEPSEMYISDYEDFGIECKICERSYGLLKDTYKLCLKGSKDNVETFISYLRVQGFKVELY